MDADGDATVSFTEWSDFLRPNAALAPLPPPIPAYVPRPYYYDPIYYPSYRYRYPSLYDSPYYYDRYWPSYDRYYYPRYSSAYTPYRFRPWYYY